MPAFSLLALARLLRGESCHVVLGFALAAAITSSSLSAQSAERVASVPLVDFGVRAGPAVPATPMMTEGLAIGTTDQQVVILDSLGRVVRRLGREGSGPGEYQLIQSLGTSGDTLLVLDATRRLTRIRMGAAASTEVLMLPAGGALPLSPLTLSGSVLVLAHVARAGDPIIAANGQLVVRARADGTILDTIGALDVRDQMMRIALRGGQQEIQLVQPFLDIDRLSASPNGLWIAVVRAPASQFARGTLGNRIEFRGPNGRSSVEVATSPAALTDETVRRWLDVRAGNLSAVFPGGSVAARSELSVRLLRPRSHPTVRSAVLGNDGVLWLLQSPTEAARDQWTLVTADEGVVGRVALPPGSRPLAVSRTTAWVLEELSDGEQEIVRYRLHYAR